MALVSSVLFFIHVLLFLNLLWAKEFRRPEQALSQIYPGSQIEVRNITLTREQVEEVQKISGAKMESRLASWYIVRKGGQIIAYGYVDMHRVRTHPEVVLYTITPDGKLDVVEVLAFYEPLEYMPEDNWLRLFAGKQLSKDPVRLRRDIPNITGATLTARAITDNARKVLALWQVLFGVQR
ncbi:MAG: FMN-binding protein [Aquificaceae bacterium]|jgi:Na+-translocating ferredoxin:NAD+ oxidoreductase RnfG subunit|uniref:FMN-binding protein n=1 Tax=Hydrogenobacter sp. Uz 6-8 TaxID=3384828 RepID=UPI000F101283|nr:MAG: FMN-binding protein [Aquificota bacterium]